jgi:hypothetical protein
VKLPPTGQETDMTQNVNETPVVVTREEIGRIQDWVGDIVKALKPEDVKRMLTRQDFLETKLVMFFHDFFDRVTPCIYKVRVNGQMKEFQIISPCPGRRWIPAWDFVNRMRVSGRLTTLDDLSAFAASHPDMGFGEQPILAGGREDSERKSDDLTHYEFYCFRNGEIIWRSHKGVQEYYRYLAVRE